MGRGSGLITNIIEFNSIEFILYGTLIGLTPAEIEDIEESTRELLTRPEVGVTEPITISDFEEGSIKYTVTFDGLGTDNATFIENIKNAIIDNNLVIAGYIVIQLDDTSIDYGQLDFIVTTETIFAIGDGTRDGTNSTVTLNKANWKDTGNDFDEGTLKGVVILNTVTSIGDDAFADCTILTLVDFSSATALTSIGNDAFKTCSSLTSVNLSTAASLISIGDYAFNSCTNLEEVVFPNVNLIKTIGTSAFQGCSSLTSVDLSNAASLTSIGDLAFNSCTNLEEVDLSNANLLETIGTSAFQGCSNLEEVDLSNANLLETIGTSAFQGCSSLASVDLSNATSLTSIGNSAFQGCTGLEELVIPYSITSIGNSVGWGTLLNIGWMKTVIGSNGTVNIPGSTGPDTNALGADYPYGAIGATSYVIGQPTVLSYNTNANGTVCNPTIAPSLTIAGIQGFNYKIEDTEITNNIIEFILYGTFSGLTPAEIGNNIKESTRVLLTGVGVTGSILISDPEEGSIIKYKATFNGLGTDNATFIENINQVIIDDNLVIAGHLVKQLDDTPIDYTPIDYGQVDFIVTTETNFAIGKGIIAADTVTLNKSDWIDTGNDIEEGALKGVVIFNTVTTIGTAAFADCTSLTSITFLGDLVTSIGSYAFRYCTSLTSITIPDSVITIWNFAFRNCTGLTSITIPNLVTSIGESAFEECTSLISITFLGDLVNSIESYTFYYCTSLTSITIPNSVITIGSRAFSECTGLRSVTFKHYTNTTVDPLTFGTKAWLNVPAMNNPVVITAAAVRTDRIVDDVTYTTP
jgi:uncharacterized protein YjbI with pentapeptide repeats